MTLNIQAKSSEPIHLVKAGHGSGEIYRKDFIEDIPTDGGIYVFGRSYGNSKRALYIGKAQNLQQRLYQQFDSVGLMTKIRDAANGGRFLIYSCPKLKQGQKLSQVITIMEKALIAYSLSEGIELLQKQGTKRPNHEINFKGNRTSELIAPRLMRLGI